MINFTDSTNAGLMGGDAMGSIASFGILIVMFVIMVFFLQQQPLHQGGFWNPAARRIPAQYFPT